MDAMDHVEPSGLMSFDEQLRHWRGAMLTLA
jgi:hypothetical protein